MKHLAVPVITPNNKKNTQEFNVYYNHWFALKPKPESIKNQNHDPNFFRLASLLVQYFLLLFLTGYRILLVKFDWLEYPRAVVKAKCLEGKIRQNLPFLPFSWHFKIFFRGRGKRLCLWGGTPGSGNLISKSIFIVITKTWTTSKGIESQIQFSVKKWFESQIWILSRKEDLRYELFKITNPVDIMGSLPHKGNQQYQNPETVTLK